jgi:hypothetical protein
MNKVTMNWKSLGDLVVDRRTDDYTVTARLMCMDTGEVFTLTVSHANDVPAHKTIGALRGFASLLEHATDTPASDAMAYTIGKLS